MTRQEYIKVVVDGFSEHLPRGMTLPELIVRNKAQHKDLVVEINGRFVPAKKYHEITLEHDDRVELIHTAFGG